MPKSVPFTKLHGAGNDIIVVEKKHLPTKGKAEFLRKMAHRQTGVGCDQFVEVLSRKPLDLQIWNGDGTQAEMCANGTRVALYLAAHEGWISKKAAKVPLKVSGKKYEALRQKDGYELCLGEPQWKGFEELPTTFGALPFHEVSVGNPHAVVICGKADGQWRQPADFQLAKHGAEVETHKRFPQRTNVEFVTSWASGPEGAMAKVETWERGAGATLSCGSGAVAVATVIRRFTGAERVDVEMSGFLLQIRFEGEKAFLTGPSALVFTGKFLI